MKVKKTNEGITYLRKTVEHTFDVEGKIVRVCEHIIDSDDEVDNDIEIERDDLATLTEDEKEMFDDEVYTFLKMKVDEDINV